MMTKIMTAFGKRLFNAMFIGLTAVGLIDAIKGYVEEPNKESEDDEEESEEE